MKNIQFTSRETGWKIFAAFALFASLTAAGTLVLPFLPPEFGEIKDSLWILATISVGLALFVWSIFRLIKPIRYDRNWQIAEMVLVPLYWLMLTTAATVCVAWLIQRSVQELYYVYF